MWSYSSGLCIGGRFTANSREIRPDGANMGPRIPNVGEVLIHRFRRRPGEIRAEVVSIDPARRSIRVRMNGAEYPSLSAAANAAARGTTQNGWIFWGLKKQVVWKGE